MHVSALPRARAEPQARQSLPYRSLVRRFRRSYTGIDAADYVIAATTLLLGADLLTTNVRHFPMLERLRPAY